MYLKSYIFGQSVQNNIFFVLETRQIFYTNMGAAGQKAKIWQKLSYPA
jgi:hypothetical protein